MNLTYYLNYPNPPDDPADDVANMQTNTNSIGSWVGVDHYGFGVNQGGYHTIIHQPTQTVGGQTVWNPLVASGVPGAVSGTKISGIQQLFSMLYIPNTTGGTADTQLFSLTGNGGISQLTGNLATSDGWVWIGGVLLQWGSFTKSGGHWPGAPVTITFKNRVVGAIPFPNACFVVLTTFMGPTSGSSADICIDSKSATSFTWEVAGNSSDPSYNGFYWIAIGN